MMSFALRRAPRGPVSGALAPAVLVLPIVLVAALVSAGSAVSPEPAEAAKRGCSHTKAVPGRAAPRKLRRAVGCLIEKRRRNHGAGGIARSRKLTMAATKHTRKMTRSRCFSHQCGGEPPLGERIRRTGYMRNAKAWSYGEVIGWGKGRRGTPRAMVDAWMRSSSHRAILLNGRFKHLGVGIKAKGPSGQKRASTYTVNFGYVNR